MCRRVEGGGQKKVAARKYAHQQLFHDALTMSIMKSRFSNVIALWKHRIKIIWKIYLLETFFGCSGPFSLLDATHFLTAI